MTAARATIIGVGNEFRRDDGVGPAVIAQLAARSPEDVTLVVTDGEPTALLDAWSGVSLAVVVDAALGSPSTPGRVHRTERDGSTFAASRGSTHGLGLPEAIRLAEALDRVPARLVVYTVEAADVGHGVGLSPEVAGAVATVADAVLAELDAG